jgi:single-strand DNA-binding protein
MNKVILIGRIGKAPEKHTFDNGNVKTSFSLATTENYKDKSGEWKESTEWHNCVVYRDTKLISGDLIAVEGKLKTRDYEKDGVKHYLTEVVVLRSELLQRKVKQSGNDMPF